MKFPLSSYIRGCYKFNFTLQVLKILFIISIRDSAWKKWRVTN